MRVIARLGSGVPPGSLVVAAALAYAAVVALSVEFVDRPVATWSHAHLAGLPGFVALTHIVDPVLPGSAIGVLAAGTAALWGWRPGRAGRTIIACCMAALMAYAVKDQLKYGFGRLWPETWVNDNPSWIRDGAYGFWPFHGGAGWGAFPSGHMAGITAPMTVLWLRLGRVRWMTVVPVALVAIGLMGADYHFVGDMLAGVAVGAASGVGVLATLHGAWSEEALEPAMGQVPRQPIDVGCTTGSG